MRRDVNVGRFGGLIGWDRSAGLALLCAIVFAACSGGDTARAAPTRSNITFAPSSLNFSGVGTAFSQTFMVSEPGYGGLFTIQTSSSCLNGSTPAAVTVTPQSGGSTTPFVATASGVGSCAIVVSDANGASASLSVTVSEIIVTPQ